MKDLRKRFGRQSDQLKTMLRRAGGAGAVRLAVLTLALAGVAGTASASSTAGMFLPVAQTEGVCATPFLGDLATWLTPKMTKALMFGGGVVVAWGIFGAPAEGRGRLSLRMALILGVFMFFMGFQWAPTWEYVGTIFADGGNVNAMTCGMG